VACNVCKENQCSQSMSLKGWQNKVKKGMLQLLRDYTQW